MKSIKFYLVDSNEKRRQEIQAALLKDANCELAGAGSDFSEAVANSIDSNIIPQVLIINIDSPESKSTRSWALIRAMFPRIKIVALTSGEDPGALENVVAAGVMALHLPDVDKNELCKVVKDVGNDKINFSPKLLSLVKMTFLSLPDKYIRIGGLVIDLEHQEVTCRGRKVHLTSQEYKLLLHLARNKGFPIKIEELLNKVWDTSLEEGGTIDQVKSCVMRIRKKIEPTPKSPMYLRSIRGRGYLLSSPIERYLAK